jgi:hypothetical protein
MLMQSFFSRSDAKGTRSTALHSLQWALGLLLAAVPATIAAKAPDWVLVGLLLAAGVVLTVFLGAYIYFLVRDPDALRSEQFTLSKMAIEKGMIGDNVAGFVDPTTQIPVATQPLVLGSDEGQKR